MSRRRVGSAAGGLGLALVLVVAGCGGNGQSTLKPHSTAARDIADLWWVMLAGSGVVLGVVVLMLAIAIVRRHGARDTPTTERRARTFVLFAGMIVPIVVLAALFGLAVHTLPATSAPRSAKSALTIEVVGHQWFWEVRYPGTDAVTANEIHIPVGETVRVRATTDDVIHSFWVPELNRKIDMIPGKTNAVLLHADRVGVYRGQCAEFCGLQHANMAFYVYADPPNRFRAWLAAEAKPRTPPATGLEREGERVFLSQACSGCHTIRGTSANGDVGPDLTHVASRHTLAAGTIPNTKGYLGGWILDPQHVKPGNLMPGLDLSGPELEALLSYLEHLR